MIDINEIERNFYSSKFNNEDDVKLQSYAHIFKPILDQVSPKTLIEFKSEHSYIHGGRADALYRNISIEYKNYRLFNKRRYITDALYGRNENDSGLYQYILNSSNINEQDNEDEMAKKIEKNIGVGFDGETFIFCRFVKTNQEYPIDFRKSKMDLRDEIKLNLSFEYYQTNFKDGIRRLILLLKQQDKIALTKDNLQAYINPNIPEVRNDILEIYNLLIDELGLLPNSNIDSISNTRIKTLYSEWESVFGILYGEEKDITDFNKVIPSVKKLYKIEDEKNIDIKIYLFAMQTYFNILLKLLVNSFIKTLVNPSFTSEDYFNITEMTDLFEGRNENQQKYVENFFEVHYYEWFTYSTKFEIKIVNSILEIINKFDMSSFILKPEVMQDIFQEVYMGLIPKSLRKVMGEYFTPDWMVEFSLDKIDYKGDISKRLVDPACGSGAFLIQALKRIKNNNPRFSYEDISTITNNIVGFDINPISAVSAKANYIISLFSSIFEDINNIIEKPISIPVYIADSVLAPVVYSEQNDDVITAKTHIGEFVIPKFNTYREASRFLDILSESTNNEESLDVFKARLNNNNFYFEEKNMVVVENLFNVLYRLHRASQDSFWSKILKNSFAPIMINEKFDFVCGNPPWISWKTMSRTYREGTGEVWRSYGIFEKNAYDKITTHDDFGMAVTYVAIDQYLKEDGEMVFILPTAFLKSGKGGHGFRKFHISRNNQDIPFSVESVDTFTPNMVFTINSSIVAFKKGKKMEYPMNSYTNWYFKDNLYTSQRKLDAHDNWGSVKRKLENTVLTAQPISMKDPQSQWLTLEATTDFIKNILSKTDDVYYRGRKGIEPLGAKGVYIVNNVHRNNNKINVTADFSRQRRADFLEKGPITRDIEETYLFPMIGGRNMERWRVKDYTFMIIPHTKEYKYGLSEKQLIEDAPLTFDYFTFYKKELLASRIQNGKRFKEDVHSFFKLDNVGEYTYSPYKVLWKEQTKSMAAVVVSSFDDIKIEEHEDLFTENKLVMMDSKVLFLSLDNKLEAHYVCGILNAENIREIIDGYAIETNRGIDVLQNINIPKFDENNIIHLEIAKLSLHIHELAKQNKLKEVLQQEKTLNTAIKELYK